MRYMLSIFLIFYGVIMHYEIFIPRIDRGGPAMYILMGIISLIVMPFWDKYDKGEKKALENHYFCFIVYISSVVLIVSYFLELITSDWAFMLAVLSTSICQVMVDFFKKLKKS